MDTAVLAGAIDLPDYDQRRREYVGCDWLPFEVGLDPLKDARAEIEQIEAYDAEQVDAEIAADKAREQSLGLAFGDPLRPSPGHRSIRGSDQIFFRKIRIVWLDCRPGFCCAPLRPAPIGPGRK
jgi:hypothetical protein